MSTRLSPPPFIFRVVEIEEDPLFAHPSWDTNNYWMPSTTAGVNRAIYPDATVPYWLCDGDSIRQMRQLPKAAQCYKQFSTYYVGGFGFRILEGDAQTPRNDRTWHTLKFNYPDDGHYTSFLTNAGEHPTLRLMPLSNSAWARLLLPTQFHTSNSSHSEAYGGLIGDLPIFLALMAFTTSRADLFAVLPHIFLAGRWVDTHCWQSNREDKRGMVVTVWTCPGDFHPDGKPPMGWTGSSPEHLKAYENGCYGKYYY